MHQLRLPSSSLAWRGRTSNLLHSLCAKVTIFLFSLAGPEGVYVDERWRARAVGGDMVVVAQSEARRDPMSPLTCGGRAVSESTLFKYISWFLQLDMDL